MPKKGTVILTGASSGIGSALSELLLKKDFRVVGIARDFSKCPIRNDHFEPVSMDLSVLAKLPEQLIALNDRVSDVRVVICSAGRGDFGSLEEFSFDQIRSLMDLNFTAQAYVVRVFLPGLKRAGRGDIILIGSEAGLSGGKRGAVYSASKFALRGFAQALRQECAPRGVRVTVINPGMVKTPFFEDLDFEPGGEDTQHILPEDIGEAVAMVISARAGTVFDEINLSPIKKQIKFKNSK